MTNGEGERGPNTADAVRTLLLAGFTIERAHTQPGYIELECFRRDELGARIPYVVGIADRDAIERTEIDSLREEAERRGRVSVFVTPSGDEHSLAWDEFVGVLGGTVPSWEALSDDYGPAVLRASRNQQPDTTDSGEPWRIFEELVATGLEFVYGRRVRRLGGRTRGSRVSDIVAVTPARTVVVVDAKAAESGFDVGASDLRPLREYTERQVERQRAHIDVTNTLIVSSEFSQGPDSLRERALEFNAEVGVPLSFMTAETLRYAVRLFGRRPDMRAGLRWGRLQRGGLIEESDFDDELEAIERERIARG